MSRGRIPGAGAGTSPHQMFKCRREPSNACNTNLILAASRQCAWLAAGGTAGGAGERGGREGASSHGRPPTDVGDDDDARVVICFTRTRVSDRRAPLVTGHSSPDRSPPLSPALQATALYTAVVIVLQ